jgi:hypothetical protein
MDFRPYRQSESTATETGVAEMKKKPTAKKKGRRVRSVLIRRDRKDLRLKDYLMEEHPELGLPLDGAKLGRTGRASRAEKGRD